MKQSMDTRVGDVMTRIGHIANSLYFKANRDGANKYEIRSSEYYSNILLKRMLDRGLLLVSILPDEDVEDGGEFSLERDARDLYYALRDRRLALKLANTEGRTPAEAASFKKKAKELA